MDGLSLIGSVQGSELSGQLLAQPASQPACQLQPIFLELCYTRLGASTQFPPLPLHLHHLHSQGQFPSRFPRSPTKPTLLDLSSFSAVHDWGPPDFAPRLLSLATMASTADAVYFPPLGQCLNGDKVLLSVCPQAVPSFILDLF